MGPSNSDVGYEESRASDGLDTMDTYHRQAEGLHMSGRGRDKGLVVDHDGTLMVQHGKVDPYAYVVDELDAASIVLAFLDEDDDS